MSENGVKTSDFKVVGTRPNRPDGIDKVTGRAKFGADMYAPGMLHAAVVRSPHAHAKIVSIDASKAQAMPEVKAVVTRADFAEGLTEPAVVAWIKRFDIASQSSGVSA